MVVAALPLGGPDFNASGRHSLACRGLLRRPSSYINYLVLLRYKSFRRSTVVSPQSHNTPRRPLNGTVYIQQPSVLPGSFFAKKADNMKWPQGRRLRKRRRGFLRCRRWEHELNIVLYMVVVVPPPRGYPVKYSLVI